MSNKDIGSVAAREREEVLLTLVKIRQLPVILDNTSEDTLLRSAVDYLILMRNSWDTIEWEIVFRLVQEQRALVATYGRRQPSLRAALVALERLI